MILLKDIHDLIENNILIECKKRGYSYKGFWNISKYILENISDKNKPFDMPISNNVINHLLTAPILSLNGNYIFKELLNRIFVVSKFKIFFKLKNIHLIW